MSSKKKAVSLILASLMVAGAFAGCGGNDDNNSSNQNNNSQAGNTGSQSGNTTVYTAENTDLSDEATNGVIKLKVWGSQDDQVLLEKLCNDFATEYEAGKSYKFEFEYGVVSEADAMKNVTGDPEASADVFAFADDQLNSLVSGGYLAKVIRNKDQIIANNDAGSIGAATVDGTLYAYPLTSDNGFFLYYDNSKLTEEDVKSWNTIISKCEANGWKIHFDLDNGWYLAGWFFGAGGSITPTTDNKTNEIDFNKYPDVADFLKTFAGSSAFVNSDDNISESGFQDGTAACAVSGVWKMGNVAGTDADGNTIEASGYMGYLGDKLSATKLPEFTTSSGTYQMGSFGGYKFYGVNTYSKAPGAAACLAEYLSSEKAQAYRFEQKGYGASNVNVQKSDAVAENIGLTALAAQSPYSKPQVGVAQAYWTASDAFGVAVMDKNNTKTAQELLDAYVAGAQEA